MHRLTSRCHAAIAAALLTAALGAGLAAPRAALAEDIDIYSGGVSADVPTIIIALDSSANWSSNIPVPNCFYRENGALTTQGPRAASPNREQGTKMAIEKCALHNVIDALPVGTGDVPLLNVGFMLFNESPAAYSGGYPRHAIVPLTATTKASLKAAIRGLTIGGDKGNNAAFAKGLYEAFLYLGNREPYRGTLGTKWDRSAVVGGRYSSPGAIGCGRQHIIFIANGRPGEVTDNEARELLRAEGGSVTPLSYPTSRVSNSDQGNWSDEFARFFRGADVSAGGGVQSVTTHAIAVTGASSDGNYPNFVRAIAAQGGGRFYEASSVDQIVEGLLEIFNQVLAVNSVFSASSLPISVNARGTYQNQIFMGMFRPAANGGQRWNGNLKQYRFSYDRTTDTLELVDARGQSAVSSATGFIDPSAASYWTQSSTFWRNAPAGTPPSASDGPDGAVVEKGGAAQQLRTLFAESQDARNVYTCIGCGAGPVRLDASGDNGFRSGNSRITRAALGVADDTQRALLIDWVRGTDNMGDEAGPGAPVTVRPSIHGDVLHSRPAVLTYGDRVVVFYGANDGMLHAVDGSRELSAGGGRPLWSFVPEEMFGKLRRLRDDEPAVRYPTTPAALDARPRDYFVDGPIGVYQRFNAAGGLERAIIYVAMRRGGRLLYAFDVTDPERPTFLWKKTNTDIPVLGQTWSEPKVARVRGHANPVIVMGAGYDPTEDATPAGATTMGNAVLVLDAITGALLRTVTGITRPVAADVALVDSDFDGYVDRAYAVDLGGSIHRIDMEVNGSAMPADWQRTTFAMLGDADGNKFFYAPDVVLTRRYAVVLAGTGDREKPLLATGSDFFFTIIDPNTGKAAPVDVQPVRLADLLDRSDFQGANGPRGCFVAMPTGEKVVNAPVTIGGITYFGTNRPTPVTPGSCTSNLGLARNYALPLLCKAPEITDYIGGGLPPSPVSGVVEVESVDPQTGVAGKRRVPFIIGGKNSKDSAIEGSRVRLPVTPRRSKLYWHAEMDR